MEARTGSSSAGRKEEGPSTSYSSADADADGTAGGAKVWLLVLLFSLLVLLLLPSAVRRGGGGGGGFQRGGITLKSGWDVVNLCLVLFAILCGLLGRGGGDGDGDAPTPAPPAAATKSHLQLPPPTAPEPTTEDVWASFNNSYPNHNVNAHTGIRRMKSSSSYPELRLGNDGVWGLASPELAWRSYDDAELYRTRREERPDADRPLRRTASDVKTIPVDTYEVRARPLPQDARRRRRSVERLPEMPEVEEERMHPVETLATPARSRTWSPEELDATLSGMPSAPAPPPQPRRRRRSVEKLLKMDEVEVEEERTHPREALATPARSRTWSPEELGATLLEMASPAPPPAPPPQPRRRRRSLETLPTMEEVEKEIIVEEINNPQSPSPAMFPPGTPPPPPPPPPARISRSNKKRSGSVGGAKELASAIALFYQKKRKSIIMKRERHHHHHHHHLSDDHYSSPSSEASASPEAAGRTNPPPRPPPPPPPLPPPSSIFSNLFKKGGSKSRRINSLAPPQPPPPPAATSRSRKPPQHPSRPAPPQPAPAPARTRPPRASSHPHQQQQPRAQGYPQQPAQYPRRGVVYYAYPLPPPSPPMPPPPPPPPMSEGEEEVPSVTASPAPSYCASPDVNTKADNFIERFRAGLKLEKINSYREKLQIQEGATLTVAEEDGELMVIGSLFEDDDDISLPETPATATAAAVAVGF